MGPICLTLAPILRCVSLTRVQSGLLLIPPGLEIYFCMALITLKWHSRDSKHLLLVAEGSIYFVWSLLDFLTHFVPAARSTLQIFKILDIVLGSLSFAPLLLYTLFLFFVARSELLQNIPFRLRSVANCTLFLLSPAILVANVLGSFLGISYRILSPPNPDLPPFLAVGFIDTKAQFLWTFFSSLTLGLLALYQALNFLLIFSRTIVVLQDKRRLEDTDNTLQIRRLRGVSYMALGMTLGMVETLVGFSHTGFGAIVARKILRFLARAVLIVGFIKGWDTLEDFSLLPQATRGNFKRRSVLNFISNPRYSTFQHVDGNTENNVARNLRTLSFPSSSNAASFQRLHDEPRVTVRFPQGRAPTLHLRMSDIFLSSEFNEAPKTAPARLDDNIFPISQTSPPPPPFSNLVPIRKGSSMMTMTRDVLAKARAQYHRYSGSGSFGLRDSVMSNEFRPPPLDYDGGLAGTTTPPRRWSRANSPSGMWLSRTVNRRRHSSGVNLSHSSTPGDPESVAPSNSKASTLVQNLTTQRTSATRSSVQTQLSHRQNYTDRSRMSSFVEPVPSTLNSYIARSVVSERRSGLTEETVTSWIQPNSLLSEHSINSFDAASLGSTSDLTESITPTSGSGFHYDTSSTRTERPR